MYVQWAGGQGYAPAAGFHPAGSGGNVYAPQPVQGVGGAPYYPQAPYASQGLYGQQPGMGVYPTPRDPYSLPAAPVQAPGLPQHAYGGHVGAQDQVYAAWPPAHGKPEYGGHQCGAPHPGQPQAAAPWPGAAPQPVQQAVAPPRTAPGQGGAPGPAEEVDPDDDPNRLPTFVKVRGLPAEHDPRIARRPKPKKRAPGICCA
uniref:Uncharacterized protein n=1 Tax=Alexandrium andersonii TaxID=327968 RepID=A0A7S2AHU9_9DINO|mmetsp:Transcript_12790/g.29002  ORF Transcript_12790/g.29002 Transcript_12790/m.29002 type:complete len:201 (+) Transcript_12790:122-724(+)